MARSYEERLNYELSKRVTKEQQKKFFSGAINRVDSAYTIDYLEYTKEFACDVLCHCGFCLHVHCDRCILEYRYLKAKEDIEAGLRESKRERIETLLRAANVIKLMEGER